MSRHPRPFLPGGLAVALAVSSATAAGTDPTPARKPGGTLSLVVENDVFAETDQHYTNGIRLSYLTAADGTPAWAAGAARLLPFFPAGGDVRAEFSFGQNMYTPDDITVPVPDPDDRPFAGWLYGAVGVVAKTDGQLDQLQLSLGVVGPSSLAEQTQKYVHEQTGADEPRGWDAQLRDEPAVQLTYQRSWRALASGEVAGLSVDATPHLGAAVGNVYVYGNAGLTLRVGQNLPDDYGPPRINPGLPGSGYFPYADRVSWYLFAGVEGRAVARNLFLDGNTSRDDGPSVDKRPFVGDVQAGLAVTWRGARFAYTHVLRTEEFEGQGDADQFGAFSVSWQW